VSAPLSLRQIAAGRPTSDEVRDPLPGLRENLMNRRSPKVRRVVRHDVLGDGSSSGPREHVPSVRCRGRSIISSDSRRPPCLCGVPDLGRIVVVRRDHGGASFSGGNDERVLDRLLWNRSPRESAGRARGARRRFLRPRSGTQGKAMTWPLRKPHRHGRFQLLSPLGQGTPSIAEVFCESWTGR